jgi:hypothetical protein
MNSLINKSLTDVRRAIQECGVRVTGVVSMPVLGVVAPAAIPPQPDPNPTAMRDVQDEMDHLDKFLKTLADSVLDVYDTDPDTAVNIVFAAISDLVAAGAISVLPDMEATPETLQIWVDTAQKAGLAGKVNELAFDQSEEIDG